MSGADLLGAVRLAARQEQFLDVISREEATARFHAQLRLDPLGEEIVPLGEARERVVSQDIAAPVDVPGFDRASVDGFAVRASCTQGAAAEQPALLRLNAEVLTPGIVPGLDVEPGTATVIATGGMLPRGADAVVMVEQTDLQDAGAPTIEVHSPAAPGQFIAVAGSDIARGDMVLRAGRVLTSREIGMLAAVGLGEIAVWRRPRIAIFSTGNEIVAPGGPIRAGQVYDSNAAVLAAAVEELGGEPVSFGIVPDEPSLLSQTLDRALADCDMVLLSGGTSKGAGDLAHQAVARLQDPGVVVHGVALKPGKPLCLAVSGGRAVAVLPGFPTSAIFTFHEFIAPVIARLAGRQQAPQDTVRARLPMRVRSERGRTEYVMVLLLQSPEGGLVAYPNAKGSGAVTAFAQADGFFAVPALSEAVNSGAEVEVRLIGAGLRPADLVVIGSQCAGLDLIIGLLERDGMAVKSLAVGSSGGLAAARRGECDIAGMHLMDPASGVYNTPFLDEGLRLVPGYGRMQGIVFRTDDARFAKCRSAADAIAAAEAPGVLMVNRNAGSGTRLLIDRVLGGVHPAGYTHAAKSHNGVAAAVVQGRADWGVAIETVARQYGLGFLPLRAEQYDFVVPVSRAGRPEVQRFVAALHSTGVRQSLAGMGFSLSQESVVNR